MRISNGNPFHNFEAYFWLSVNHSDIYFIGGFGTVAWVDVKEYETLQPDKIAVDGGEQNLKVRIIKTFTAYLNIWSYLGCVFINIHA